MIKFVPALAGRSDYFISENAARTIIDNILFPCTIHSAPSWGILEFHTQPSEKDFAREFAAWQKEGRASSSKATRENEKKKLDEREKMLEEREKKLKQDMELLSQKRDMRRRERECQKQEASMQFEIAQLEANDPETYNMQTSTLQIQNETTIQNVALKNMKKQNNVNHRAVVSEGSGLMKRKREYDLINGENMLASKRLNTAKKEVTARRFEINNNEKYDEEDWDDDEKIYEKASDITKAVSTLPDPEESNKMETDGE